MHINKMCLVKRMLNINEKFIHCTDEGLQWDRIVKQNVGVCVSSILKLHEFNNNREMFL